jgi:hypothetical protein
MSTFSLIIFICLAATAVRAFYYKLTLQRKIYAADKRQRFNGLAFRLFSIVDFFPMLTRYKPPEETALRKRVNKALYVFYGCFVAMLLLSAVLGESADIDSKMLGTWAAVGDENPAFVITKDKIMYPDQNKSYGYTLKNDSLHIRYEGFVAVFSVSVRGSDTLILAVDERQVFYRFRK